MGSTGWMITLAVLLIAGAAAVAAAVQRRPRRGRPASGLDAEAEANHWLVRLAGGLVPPDVRAWAGADETAGRSLTNAAECHRAARARLAAARTAAEYGEATRLAREGLEHLRAARTALDRNAAPTSVPAPVPAPTSVPAPVPAPVPASVPASVPAPVQASTRAPATAPAPAPAPARAGFPFAHPSGDAPSSSSLSAMSVDHDWAHARRAAMSGSARPYCVNAESG